MRLFDSTKTFGTRASFRIAVTGLASAILLWPCAVRAQERAAQGAKPGETKASAEVAAPASAEASAATTGKGTDGAAADTAKDAAKDGGKDDRVEDPGRNYIYIGARYRGTVLPAFLLDAFLKNTQSFYQNSVGIEVDFRRNGFSIIPNLTFSEYGTGDVLFADKTRDLALASNWGYANSHMKGLYAGVDLLWSIPMAPAFDFELGFGVGVGAIFGDLYVNWVYESPTGTLVAPDGRTFALCQTVNDGFGCAVADHENATVAKVGGYKEPSWFEGGAKPPMMPFVAAPQLGVRWKPVRDVETRFGLGFSLTGFWFGVSANYAVHGTR